MGSNTRRRELERERWIVKHEAQRMDREIEATHNWEAALNALYEAYPDLRRSEHKYVAGWGYMPTFSYPGQTPKRHYWMTGTFYSLCGQWDTVGPQWVVPEYKEGDTRDPAWDEPDPPDDDPGNCKHCLKVLKDRRWAGFGPPTVGVVGGR